LRFLSCYYRVVETPLLAGSASLMPSSYPFITTNARIPLLQRMLVSLNQTSRPLWAATPLYGPNPRRQRCGRGAASTTARSMGWRQMRQSMTSWEHAGRLPCRVIVLHKSLIRHGCAAEGASGSLALQPLRADGVDSKSQSTTRHPCPPTWFQELQASMGQSSFASSSALQAATTSAFKWASTSRFR